MTLFESLSLAIAAGQMLVGLTGVVLVWVGVRQMIRANDDRTAQLDQQRHEAEQREKRADQRHDEAMEVLRQQGEALRILVKGMETVIERTAPKEQRPAPPGGEAP